MTEREKLEMLQLSRQVMREELADFEQRLFVLLTHFVECLLNDLAEVLGDRKRLLAEEMYKRLTEEARNAALKRAGF